MKQKDKKLTGFELSLLGKQEWPPRTIKAGKLTKEQIDNYESNISQDILLAR